MREGFADVSSGRLRGPKKAAPQPEDTTGAGVSSWAVLRYSRRVMPRARNADRPFTIRCTALFRAPVTADRSRLPAGLLEAVRRRALLQLRRHKARFRMLARGDSQDLPLLPGEFEFPRGEEGGSAQFQDFSGAQAGLRFRAGSVALDTVSSRRPGCRCDHDTRTVMCRLYPLLPVFDIDGRLTGTEKLGVFEELEVLEGLAPACQISALPFEQMDLFLRICELLAVETRCCCSTSLRIARPSATSSTGSRRRRRQRANRRFALYRRGVPASAPVRPLGAQGGAFEPVGDFEARYGRALRRGDGARCRRRAGDRLAVELDAGASSDTPKR